MEVIRRDDEDSLLDWMRGGYTYSLTIVEAIQVVGMKSPRE